MSKKRTPALLDLRSKYENRNHGQGIGYFVPATMTLEQWKKLRKEWNKKLRSSGFFDIEQFSSNCDGTFSPYFFKDPSSKSRSGSAATEAAQYKPARAEYYRRIGIFRHHAPFQELFLDRSLLFYYLALHISEGGTMQAFTDWLRSKDAPKEVRQKKSIWWIHQLVHEMNAVMDKWFLDNEEYCE